MGGAIPGPAPLELIMPVDNSMGKKLLKTMGWREGQGVGSRVQRTRNYPMTEDQSDGAADAELHEQALAVLGDTAKELVDRGGLTFAPGNTKMKLDSLVSRSGLHGVGYDPFRGAPEFGSARAMASSSSPQRGVYRTSDVLGKDQGRGVGMGRSKEGDSTNSTVQRGTQGFALDDAEDDVYDSLVGNETYDAALDLDGAESGLGQEFLRTGPAPTSKSASTSRLARGQAEQAEQAEQLPLVSRRHARCPSDGRLPPAGFIVAREPDNQPKHWPPPEPPAGFIPLHKMDEGVLASEQPLASRSVGGMGPSERAQLLGESSRDSANDRSRGSPPTRGAADTGQMRKGPDLESEKAVRAGDQVMVPSK